MAVAAAAAAAISQHYRATEAAAVTLSPILHLRLHPNRSVQSLLFVYAVLLALYVCYCARYN